jgi:hypothetical protein
MARLATLHLATRHAPIITTGTSMVSKRCTSERSSIAFALRVWSRARDRRSTAA